MKYCKNITEAHPFIMECSNSLIKIEKLLVNEGLKGANPFTDTEHLVVNMDHVETYFAKKEKRNERSSMDFSFGISSPSEKYVLAELRFNYKKITNISKVDLIHKVEGSITTLKGKVELNSEYLFIFQSNQKEQARSLFYRNLRMPKNYLVKDVTELKTDFFS
ncbi:hypothetical protein E0W68_10090 [Flavobacterium salilacus subsp. salilacus]|uniref:hypothetical protein n=1 Tax=Flavobacterium TaxID=237 RepID=UPI00107509B2|nr:MULTISPECIES: hypothetical protein [Flavobacterium]KAF2518361.1 hypothetical protein E0W68_10090 [Flavobacterium salilacus subsp. salilacus]MBE1615223.1 hypothetical protein [Flavobacterium sp. SaA2.13]